MKPMSSIWSASSRTKISTLREVGITLAEVVEQAARRGDDDVDATRQRLALRAMADAAEDGGDGEAELGAVQS